MISYDDQETFQIFLDSLSTIAIAKLCPPPRKVSRRRAAKGWKDGTPACEKPITTAQEQSEDADELNDFVNVRSSALVQDAGNDNDSIWPRKSS